MFAETNVFSCSLFNGNTDAHVKHLYWSRSETTDANMKDSHVPFDARGQKMIRAKIATRIVTDISNIYLTERLPTRPNAAVKSSELSTLMLSPFGPFFSIFFLSCSSAFSSCLFNWNNAPTNVFSNRVLV